MLKLAKYLKPYWWMVITAIVLLFIQANTDLALPDYMSRIVNKGIQQGGVENAVPLAVRQSQMTRMNIFMSADDKTRMLNSYTLVDKNSSDYASYVKTYPILATEPIMVLNKNLAQSEIDWLNPVMGKAILAVSGIQQAVADPAKAAAMSSGGGLDLSQLPKGMDVFTLLAKAPADQIAKINGSMSEKFAALGNNSIVQAAAGPIRDEYTALGYDTTALQSNYILNIGMIMIAISLLGMVCTVAVGYLSAYAGSGLARDLRRAVFQKVEGFSSTEMDKFSTASLITRSTNDVTQIQMLVIMSIRMIFYAPIMGVGGILRALEKDSSMWWIIALAVGMLLILIATVFSLSLPKFQIMQKLIDRLNLVTRENLSGLMVIRAFNMQNFELDRFDIANKDLTATSLYINRVMVFMFPSMGLIMNGVTLLILWVGAQQVAASAMQVGDMIAFMQYAIQIVFSFMFMSFMFFILPRAQVSAVRISEVLETPLSIKDPEQPKQLKTPFTGTVEFDNVSFRYPGADQDVLCGITFTARPGQTTALIGSTGSGKSTLANLIPRFYDISSGSIRIDGVDIREVTQHDLRSRIGYVPQKSVLFSGTIQSNLQYADPTASPEDLSEAIAIAQATEVVDENAEGMASEIAQGGANKSGGQKQRLSIARALVKKAPIYIFDDSFSALDFRTDAALRRALKEKTANSTLLVVTQRVSTIKTAEQIIVLDDGQVMGIGTHKELMATCETYREIALSQLSLEELS
jgi:ATP-binding cassette subfamily B multidrug efflux pump